ncbi:MAG: ThuA domain-containing protein [Spirosomataceae bacterium]
MNKLYLFSIFLALGLALDASAQKKKTIRTLIVDGQNNHVQWPKITFMIKKYLEETGRFSVDVKRTKFTWEGEEFIKNFPIDAIGETQAMKKSQTGPDFSPEFSKYDLVICNFGWNAAPWPDETQKNFEKFMKSGGGLVVIHAADNSFPQWLDYNKMIGLGGWGDRTEKDGPYVYYNDEGKLIKDTTPGKAGSHGPQHEYVVETRNPNHPIMKGMPIKWLHTKDELYDRLRGPAENMEVLATAYSSKDLKGTGRHEPILMVLNYGKGRIFHTPMGHVDYSIECVGFITCLLRGSEWAATGKVSFPIPSDFPTAEKSSSRVFK